MATWMADESVVVFRWPGEAENWYESTGNGPLTTSENDEAGRRILVAKLMDVSGNPRDACRRFLHQLGSSRSLRIKEWTKAEQQRLIDLVTSMPVGEAACRILHLMV
jgi:hypothetical protein